MNIILQRVLLILGIILNAIGAWYISRCLIKKTEKEMITENYVVDFWNDNYVLSSIKQKIEGTFGASYIIFGSIVQVYTIVCDIETVLFPKMNIILSVIIIIAILIVILSTLIIITNTGIRKLYLKRVIAFIRIYRKIDNNTHIAVINRYIKYVDKDYNDISDKAEAISMYNSLFK